MHGRNAFFFVNSTERMLTVLGIRYSKGEGSPYACDYFQVSKLPSKGARWLQEHICSFGFRFLTAHTDNDRVIEEMVTSSLMKQTLPCVKIGGKKKKPTFFSRRLSKVGLPLLLSQLTKYSFMVPVYNGEELIEGHYNTRGNQSGNLQIDYYPYIKSNLTFFWSCCCCCLYCLGTAKETIIKTKRQPTQWEKNFCKSYIK